MTQEKFQKQFGGEIKKIKGKKWLVFSGSLYCSHNQLESLPANLKVGGGLYCPNNQLKSLPANLKIGGSLDCYNNQLKSLPANLKISGDLYCSYNQLKSLPANLKIGGSLYCSNNQLKSLPANLKVGGGLYCHNNQLKKVPYYIRNINNCYIFENVNWNDPVWINKILQDKLSAEEVFAIDNIEHRRIAYQYMDKRKMKQLKNYRILDEVKDDGYGNPMKIISFNVQNMSEDLIFLNCFCPSTKREYFLQTNKTKCWEAKNASFGLDEVEWVKEY